MAKDWTTTEYIYRTAFCACVVGLMYTACVLAKQPVDDPDTLRYENTQTIEKLGDVAALLTLVSDRVASLSHYTDGHDKLHPFCPVCGKKGPQLDLPAVEHDDTDSRSDQTLVDDAHEIQHGLRAFEFSLLAQAQALDHAIDTLKEQDK